MFFRLNIPFVPRRQAEINLPVPQRSLQTRAVADPCSFGSRGSGSRMERRRRDSQSSEDTSRRFRRPVAVATHGSDKASIPRRNAWSSRCLRTRIPCGAWKDGFAPIRSKGSDFFALLSLTTHPPEVTSYEVFKRA